jgi:hypothetical protein
MEEQQQVPEGADPKGLTKKMSSRSERRWAVTGCVGCMGFMVLAVLFTILGVKAAQSPDAVWGQLRTYMDFEGEPDGFAPLYVVPFFDSRQVVFYRESDTTLVFVQEYSGRERDRFDEALDVEFVAAQDSAEDASAGTLTLQDREVDYVRFTYPGDFLATASTDEGFRTWLLEKLGMQRHEISDIVDSTKPSATLRLRFSTAADVGGTILMVSSTGTEQLDEAALEELFAPFDLWAHVGSTPVLVPDAVWAKFGSYLAFEDTPEDFGTLFVLPTEDLYQTAVYRESDNTILFAQQYGPGGPGDALDVRAAAEQFQSVQEGELQLQGSEVKFLRYLDNGISKVPAPPDVQLHGMLLVSAIVEANMPAAVIRLQIPNHDSDTGTILTVRAPSALPMDQAALESLLQPFDLWAQPGQKPSPAAADL